jgi:hypothetical protein
MPTNRRFLARRRAAANFSMLNTWQAWALTSARPEAAAALSGWPADDEDLWREAWEMHGETLLSEYIAESPGRRPWPWWCFTYGQERPIINPVPPDVDAQFRAENTIFGYLHSSIEHGYGANGRGLVPWQEHETDYLERHGLLSDSEVEALEADDDLADDDLADDDEGSFDD